MVCCGGWSAGCCRHWWHSRSPTGPVWCNLVWRCNCQGEKESWVFTPGTNCPTCFRCPWAKRTCRRIHAPEGLYRHVWPEKHSWNRILEHFFLIMVHSPKDGVFRGNMRLQLQRTYKNGNCANVNDVAPEVISNVRHVVKPRTLLPLLSCVYMSYTDLK